MRAKLAYVGPKCRGFFIKEVYVLDAKTNHLSFYVQIYGTLIAKECIR